MFLYFCTHCWAWRHQLLIACAGAAMEKKCSQHPARDQMWDHGDKQVPLIAIPSPACCSAWHGQTWGCGRWPGAAVGRWMVTAWQRAAPTWMGHENSLSSVQRRIRRLRALQSVSLPPEMETVEQLLAVTCSIMVNRTWYLAPFWKVREDPTLSYSA